MKARSFVLVVVVACGGGLPDAADGGDSGVDGTVGDSGGGGDAGVDSALDGAPDGGTFDDGGADAKADAPDAGPTQPWALEIGNNIYNLGLDAQKNIYAVGTFGNSDGFLVEKLDPNGNPKWVTKGTTPSATWHGPYTIAVDAQGNSYASGQTYEPMMIGNTSFAAGGYIVKLDPTGAVAWKRDALNAVFWDVSAKTNGNLVLCGEFGSPVDFGGGTMTPAGSDVIVLELTPANAFVRARQFGPNGISNQIARKCTVDKADNVVLGGWFEVSLDFGGGVMTGPPQGSSSYNIFLAKLDPTFNYVAQRDLKTSGGNHIGAIGTDAAGNVYVTGGFGNQVDLGGGQILGGGGEDIFLGKLTTSLGHVWSKRLGDAKKQGANGVTVDANGNLGVYGYYAGQLNFGCGALPMAAGDGIFLARLDSSGNCLSQFGAAQANTGALLWGAAPLLGPDWAIAAMINGPIQLPSGQLAGSQAGFIARLAP